MKHYPEATFEKIEDTHGFVNNYGLSMGLNDKKVRLTDLELPYAFRYVYTGPGAEEKDIGPHSYAVRYEGKWWDFFDGEINYSFPTVEDCFDYLADMEYCSLHGLPLNQLDPHDYLWYKHLRS